MSLLNVGTPLWKKPTVSAVSGERPTETRCVLPPSTTDEHTVFCGVTARHDEPDDGPEGVPCIASGQALARVMGPVSDGDSLGRSNGHDYLAPPTAGAAAVATARQSVPSGVVRVIEILIGGGAGGGGGADGGVYE